MRAAEHRRLLDPHDSDCPARLRSAIARELAPLLAELEAERAAAVAGEARLRAALEVARVAIESTHARGGGVRDTIDAALAAPPSAALAKGRELRALLVEVAASGVEWEDESSERRYVSVQLDRDDFREHIPAALAATAFLGGGEDGME
jgi:hypothetical protein